MNSNIGPAMMYRTARFLAKTKKKEDETGTDLCSTISSTSDKTSRPCVRQAHTQQSTSPSISNSVWYLAAQPDILSSSSLLCTVPMLRLPHVASRCLDIPSHLSASPHQPETIVFVRSTSGSDSIVLIFPSPSTHWVLKHRFRKKQGKEPLHVWCRTPAVNANWK